MSSANFDTLDEFAALLKGAPAADAQALEAAATRNSMLTKPPAALGRLEDVAIWYAGWRGTAVPVIAAPQAIVFAGNHGIAQEGVSAFPSDVTAQMVANFETGGAAINQLSRIFGAQLSVVALELENPTQSFLSAPAMSEPECVAALTTGWDAVDPGADILILGEMGIGNTTAAAALAHALYGGAASDWTGRGTGIDDPSLARKTDVVAKAVALHGVRDPLQILRHFAGREMAAICGAVARARAERIPVILDGFIVTASVATLHAAAPDALDHCIAGHVSAEQAHANLLTKIGKEPLLSLGLRLGEGSGAATALAIVQAAIACHSGMASFAEAGVSEKSD